MTGNELLTLNVAGCLFLGAATATLTSARCEDPATAFARGWFRTVAFSVALAVLLGIGFSVPVGWIALPGFLISGIGEIALSIPAGLGVGLLCQAVARRHPKAPPSLGTLLAAVTMVAIALVICLALFRMIYWFPLPRLWW
jgi:hypothetical protein